MISQLIFNKYIITNNNRTRKKFMYLELFLLRIFHKIKGLFNELQKSFQFEDNFFQW